MIPFVEFHSQLAEIGPEISKAVDSVLSSGWFVLGKQVQSFEEEFAAYLGARHAVGTASGTDAIAIALRALGIEPGDEVITAANTCVPTVCGIENSGATARLADVDPGTLTLAPEALEAAVTKRTRAVVPVHLYGRPCDMDGIRAVAERHGLRIVEDCAQAHGTAYRGRKCGTFGHAAAFSFYPTKNLGAYGDGGAVVTDDDAVAERARMLRNYGEERRYHHAVKGFNSRLDELQAAVLRVKLGYLEPWNERRRERAALYDRLLEGTRVGLPREAAWAHHVYHLYVVRSAERDALQEHLRRNEVGTLIHYPVPIHLQEAYRGMEYREGAFPAAEEACRQVLSLPLYPHLTLECVERVAEAVRGFRR